MSIYELHRRRLVQVRGELEESRALNRELLEALKEVYDTHYYAVGNERACRAQRMMKAAIDKVERGTQ